VVLVALTEQEKERIAEEEELRVEIRNRSFLRNFSYVILLTTLYGIGLYYLFLRLQFYGLIIGYVVIFIGTYLFLRRLETG
jgi:uncharacterized membrane protein